MSFSDYANEIKITEQTHPLYYKEIERLYDKYFPQAHLLSLEQIEFFKELKLTAQMIADALAPLKIAGLRYKLTLVGGAVRDLVMNRTSSINDLDILINITGSIMEVGAKNDLYVSEDEFSRLKVVAQLHAKNYPTFESKVYLSELEIEKEKLMLFKLIEKNLSSKNIQFNSFRSHQIENKYMNRHISSIFQIPGVNNKKIDLIVSEDRDLGFVTTFDFEICKGYINLNKLIPNNELNKKSESVVCLNEMFLLPSMLRDIGYKTLSICAHSFTVQHIDYFMNKHYLKLKEKFPEYEFNPFTKNNLKQLPAEKQEEIKGTMARLNYYKIKERFDNLQLEINENVGDNRVRLKL